MTPIIIEGGTKLLQWGTGALGVRQVAIGMAAYDKVTRLLNYALGRNQPETMTLTKEQLLLIQNAIAGLNEDNRKLRENIALTTTQNFRLKAALITLGVTSAVAITGLYWRYMAYGQEKEV